MAVVQSQLSDGDQTMCGNTAQVSTSAAWPTKNTLTVCSNTFSPIGIRGGGGKGDTIAAGPWWV